MHFYSDDDKKNCFAATWKLLAPASKDIQHVQVYNTSKSEFDMSDHLIKAILGLQKFSKIR